MGNTPKLRFEGFTDAWEQRKLSDLAIFNPKAELPDIFEYVDLESVVGTEMLSHRTESKRTAPSRAQRLAQTGDLFYQTVRPYQKNNYLFEKPDKHYVFSTGYAQMRPVVDGRFLLCLVQNDGFVKVVLDNCTGTSYPAINSNDLAEIEVYSPGNPQEQKQIGDFFKEIDTLITLHQRKCDALAKAKTFYLQNLFPQEGEKEPKLRLDGFTGAWKEFKCEDIFDRVGKLVEKETGVVYREIGIRSHGKGLFYKDTISGEELGNKRVYWIEPDCFIVNIVFAWERAVAKTTMNEIGMIASHRFPMYKPKAGIADLEFITKFFITNKGKEILELASPGGAGRNKTLGQKEFAESKLWLPSYEEQKCIGEIIDNLDTLITRQEHRIKALKTMKKFMLQNMFPQEG